MDIWSAGIAEKRAELLKASKNWARQIITRKTSFRVRERFLGSPSTSVSVGECVGGGDIGTERDCSQTVQERAQSRQDVGVRQFGSAPVGEGWLNGSAL